jgi:hypothetical protein
MSTQFGVLEVAIPFSLRLDQVIFNAEGVFGVVCSEIAKLLLESLVVLALAVGEIGIDLLE